MSYLTSLRGKRAAVVGVGVSNRPLVRLLENAGADITLYDKKPVPPEFSHLPSHTGEDYLRGIEADVVFRSPGVKPSELLKAVENGAKLTSEMEVFLEICPCDICGVTGSDGKTTTTTIIHKLLTAMGKTVHIGGNIGTPLLDKAETMSPNDLAVLELSSFQLMTMRKSPKTAVITNLSPNHLDWHRDMDEYIQAKTNIFKHGAERVILNADNPLCRELKPENPVWFGRSDDCAVRLNGSRIISNGSEILDIRDILIPGVHNIENYMAAIAAAMPTPEAARQVASTFGGVEHRLELAASVNGVRYYNDSIASSPTRTLAGLRVFDGKVILIAGGRPKVGFDELAAVIGDYAKTVLLVGEAAGEMQKAFAGKTRTLNCGDVRTAVKTASDIAKEGDVVLLSPACTSFDQFTNFEERGRLFKSCVEEINLCGTK